MSEQIKVSFANLAAIEKKMGNLNKSLRNRKITINFANARGSVADSMIESAEQLNKIGNALYTLTSVTEHIIKNARMSFEEADAKVAEKFLEWMDGIQEVK